MLEDAEDDEDEDADGVGGEDGEERSAAAAAVTESDWTAEQQTNAIVAMNQLMGVKKRCMPEPVKRGRPKADVAQPCPVCDKAFANSSLLKQHLTMHTGVCVCVCVWLAS